MKFGIQLLNEFVLKRGNDTIPTRSYGRIYALLALNMDAGVSRKGLIPTVWPDLDPKTASNRMRVALSTLRREMGGALIEDDERIRLNPDLVEVDTAELIDILAKLDDEVDEAEELRILEANLDRFAAKLFPEFDDDWAIEQRAMWTGVALEAIRRTCQLARKADDHRLTIRAIEAGFNHDPYDNDLWRQYLDSSTLLGEKTKALTRFSQARRTYGETLQGDFDPQTLEHAAALRESPFSFAAKGETPLSPKEVELFTRVVARVLKDEPEVARSLFGARCAFFEEANVLDTAHSLLTRLSQDTDDRSLAWQKCTLNLMSLDANKGDIEGILRLGNQILDVSVDPFVRGATLAYLSFASLTKLDSEQALSLAEECISSLMAANQKEEAMVYYLNKASALVGLGRFEEAAVLSREGADFFLTFGDAIADIRVCGYRHTLAYCLALMNRFEEASVEAQLVLDMLFARQYEPSYGNQISFASYVIYKATRNPKAIDTAIFSLKAAYRAKNVMIQIRALECIAGIIQEAGQHAQAQELLSFSDEWRLKTQIPRHLGNQTLVDGMMIQKSKNNILVDTSPRDAMIYAIKVLRTLA